MGTGLPYLSRKPSSSRTESDQLEAMAECKARDAASPNPETWISHDDVRRYTAAFQVAQEFLKKSGSIMDRQRILESELETCHERYDSAQIVFNCWFSTPCEILAYWNIRWSARRSRKGEVSYIKLLSHL